MNDSIYIQQVTILLNAFVNAVKQLGKLNLHDINVNAENFFCDLLKKLYGWNLINVNEKRINEPGIDLADVTLKMIIQVSATATPQKIQHSFEKADKKKFHAYNFKFLFLTDDVSKLKKQPIKGPNDFCFDPMSDILDINTILASFHSCCIEKKKEIWNIVKEHLHPCLEPVAKPTALAETVKILSAEMEQLFDNVNKVSFVIMEKIKQNNLSPVIGTITDHAIYTNTLNKIYESLEIMGKNPRRAIHSTLRRIFEDNSENYMPEELYRRITDLTKEKVMNSSNYPIMLFEEDVEWAVSVIIADAFEACKIFEHPKHLQELC